MDTNSHFSCKVTLSTDNVTLLHYTHLHVTRLIQIDSNQKSKKNTNTGAEYPLQVSVFCC